MAPSWQELPLSLDALLLLLQVQWRLFHEWVGSLPKLVRVVALMLSLVLVQVVAVQIFFGCLNLCANVRKTLNRVPLITGRTKKKKEVKTLVVLGSGGHTAEMLRIMKFMNFRKYRPRVYVVSSTDKMSEQRAMAFENQDFDNSKMPAHLQTKVLKIPRSREVGQSYFTSVFTTLFSLFASIACVAMEKPSLLLCNGPGTCLPVCLSMRILQPLSGKIVFIESICRTRSLSLTGKILYHLRLADEIFVQWCDLKEQYPRVTFTGRVF